MAGVESIAGSIVKDYLARFPETPSMTLSRKIFADHKNNTVFKNAEAVRDIVRYYRANRGQENRRRMSKNEFISPPRPINPFDAIPEGIKDFKTWEPQFLPESRTLLLEDLHAPYHDKKAIEIALETGKKAKVDGVLISEGIDFHQLSFWEKDPRKRDASGEMATLRQLILGIKAYLGKGVKSRYRMGNHCERLIRYMKVKAPELMGFQVHNFAHLLKNVYDEDKDEIVPVKGLEDVEVCRPKRILRINKLNVVHGHEFGGDGAFSPVNPARGLYMRGKECAIAGHNHQTSQHTETTMNGDVIATWSVGCLCDLHPEYRPINKWNHGFAIIEQNDDGFRVHNYKIINGKVYS